MTKRDPFEELGETLGALVEQNQAAGQDEARQGARGERVRPRYPSEAARRRLTLDVDLEPCVGAVMAALAARPPADYGQGPIRPGDLGTAALMHGLLAFARGELAVTAEWTPFSRGQRRIDLAQGFDEAWGIAVLEAGIERFEG